jgi:putative DNA primase/helicase
MKGDINDTMRAEGVDGVRRRHDSAIPFDLMAMRVLVKERRPALRSVVDQYAPDVLRDAVAQIEREDTVPLSQPLGERDSGTPADKFKPFDVSDFLGLKIPPREMLLDPIIPQKGLVMLYASRGCGKTHIAHGIGYGAATGGGYLRWRAPKPRRVLIVDGEMPGSLLQERLRDVTGGAMPPHGMLNLLPADMIEGEIGNFADPKVQQALDPWLDGIELLMLDNLSSLTSVIRDNDAESWNPIQAWLLRLRRRGISVLIIHHAGKDGAQRGTSRREDVLDTVISLRRPTDYVPSEGARFEVHLEKCRGIHGMAANPFEAKLEVRDGACLWTTRDIEDANLARVAALAEDGLSVRDIAEETGIPKSTVQRLKKKADEAKQQSANRPPSWMGQVSQ